MTIIPKTAIVIGGNFGVGAAAAVDLLYRGFNVRVICRNPNKAFEDKESVFNNELYQSVIVTALANDTLVFIKGDVLNDSIEQICRAAFAQKGSENDNKYISGDIYVFMTTGPRGVSNIPVDSEGVARVLASLKLFSQKISELHLPNNDIPKIRKFCLVTSMFVTRPWHPIAMFLNSMVPLVLGHKMKGENILRQFASQNEQNSNDPVLGGLEYLILRPGGLSNKSLPTSNKEVVFGQGDNLSGRHQISRQAVGKILVSAALSPTLLNKDGTKNPGLTFETAGEASESAAEPFDADLLVSRLKCFNDEKYVDRGLDEVAIHRKPLRIVKFVFATAVILGLAGIGSYFMSGKAATATVASSTTA